MSARERMMPEPGEWVEIHVPPAMQSQHPDLDGQRGLLVTSLVRQERTSMFPEIQLQRERVRVPESWIVRARC